MGRKSAKTKTLEEKWEQKLKNVGLSMRRGENSKLSYGHDFARLVDDGRKIRGGRRNGGYKNLGQTERDGLD